MNKVRIGVVGLGRLGFTHAENIRFHKKIQILLLLVVIH
jgi:predicted dehydrogenase